MQKLREDSAVSNQLRSFRSRLGFSQQDLARHASVTRQTISGLESGQYAPSAAVALRLARALNCRVEDLFWLEDDVTSIPATVVGASGSSSSPEMRVAVAKVGGHYVAHPLRGESAFLEQLRPADGVLEEDRRIQLLQNPEQIEKTVAIAGCAPALSLWARSAEQWYPGLRTLSLHANSTEALQALCRNEVHIAGIHLQDHGTGEANTSFVREMFADRGSIVLVQLGTWEEGLVLTAGNPKRIRRVEDLAHREDCRLINREIGAGARHLLDNALSAAGIPTDSVPGYPSEVRGHAAVGRAVAAGNADVGITTSGIAAIFGLDFIPLQQTRYDLAIRKEYLQHEPVRQLLSTLDHRWVRTQLRLSGGFDTHGTGEVTAEV